MIEKHLEEIGKFVGEQTKEAVETAVSKANEDALAIADSLQENIDALGDRIEQEAETVLSKAEATTTRYVNCVVERQDSLEQDLSSVRDEMGIAAINWGKSLTELRDSLQAALDETGEEQAQNHLEQVEALTAQLKAQEAFEKQLSERLSEIKDGEKGDQGEQGDDGRDGLDRPLLEPVELDGSRTYSKNTLGTHNNGLWIATKEAQGDPESDPHAWHCILDAMTTMSVALVEGNEFNLSTKLATGRIIEDTFKVPFPVHKGIWEEGTKYSKDDWVTKGSSVWRALEDTDGCPPGNGWLQILKAPRGPKGEKGDSIVGPQGKPGRNGSDGKDGKDAEIDWEVQRAFVEGIMYTDSRSASYPLRSFRGWFSEEESYQVGDVVRENNTLVVVTQAIPSGSKFFEVAAESTEVMFEPKRMGEPSFMRWRGDWQAGLTYAPNQVVTDGQWTMISNKTTTDRAGPVAAAPEESILPDTPTWDIDPENTSVVYTGHLYTFTESGWLKRFRAWVPELTNDTNYRFVAIRNPFGENPQSEILEEPILNENTWTTLSIHNSIYAAGEQLLIYIDALNSGSSTPTIGGWGYTGADNNVPPAAGSWNHTTQEDTVRINILDLDTTDRGTELMGMVSGTTIRFSDSTEPAIFKEYRTTADPIDNGDHIVYSVSLINTNGNLTTGATDMDASTPIAQPTKWKEEAAVWPAANPSWCTVQGFKQFNGVDQPGNENTAFGIDISFTVGAVSPDWDAVATINSSPGVAGDVGINSILSQVWSESVDNLGQGGAPQRIERLENLMRMIDQAARGTS